MGYIGNPIGNGFDFIDKQTFTGDGTTTAFTMSHAVGKEELIEVYVGNVRQDPGIAYTVNNLTLTFTGAPALGESIYIINNNAPIRINEPAPNSVDSGQIKDNAVTAAKIPDGSITQAKLDSSVSSGG